MLIGLDMLSGARAAILLERLVGKAREDHLPHALGALEEPPDRIDRELRDVNALSADAHPALLHASFQSPLPWKTRPAASSRSNPAAGRTRAPPHGRHCF